MSEGPDIARLAALIGDPARANMLLALLAVPALTAGELAVEAGVTPQTASGHLRLMEDNRLVVVRKQGRHRYYELADAGIGGLLEQLLGAAATLGFSRTRPGPKDQAMRRARTCYDHMAGEIAVGLFRRMHGSGMLSWAGDELRLTEVGETAFTSIGVAAEALSGPGRPTCLACLDWSERRPHLAGRAGAALLQYFLRVRWVEQSGRLLKVTSIGERGLENLFSAPA